MLAVTGSEAADSSKPLSGLAEFKQRWEVGWASDWKLVESKEENISDFISGYVLVWERRDGNRHWTRTDSFTTQWRFYSAHEELREDDRLVSRGPIIITQEGVPLFRIAVHVGNAIRNDALRDYEVLYYELALLDSDNSGCVYRSSSNFLGNQAGEFRGLSRVPDDAQQVSGGSCPSP